MSELELGGEQTATLGDTSATDAAVLGQETQEPQGGGQPSFQDRVRNDPDYAWEQIRKRDAMASTYANRIKEMEPIAQLVQFAGGAEPLIDAATNWTRVNQIPGLAQLVQSALATGRVESAAPTRNAQEEDDAWIDPDVKKVRDQFRAENENLRSELAELRQMASGADIRARDAGLRENVEQVLEMFGDNAEARMKAADRMRDAVATAMSRAQRGDETQAALIRQLSEPGGIAVLESVAFPVFKETFGPKAGLSSNAQNQAASGNGARRQTDERTVNPSRPGNSPLPPLPKGRVQDSSVLKVFEEAARRKGYNPSLL